MRIEYETINCESDRGESCKTQRMKVFGGWIVRSQFECYSDCYASESSVFVSDPNHEWKIED